MQLVAQIINGKQIAKSSQADTAKELESLARIGVTPTLVALEVGESPASALYLKWQAKAAKKMGIVYQRHPLPVDISERQLQREIGRLNHREDVTGILIQMPLPQHLNPQIIRRALAPAKDVEGVHPENLGHLLSGRPTIIPCTAAAAMMCIAATGVQLQGADAVVVGHSEIVGKPVALLLMEQLATVTTCHHATRDLKHYTRHADVLVVAVGKAGLITGDMVKPGAVVIDIGINEVQRNGERHVVGDVSFDEVEERVGWITPVPGGVGPVTVSMLLRNTVKACARQGPLAI